MHEASAVSRGRRDPLGEVSPQEFRPIHYLGSKLRALPHIVAELDRLDPTRGPACDLFAGSGTVSHALSYSRQVLSVDIQEYSRVLCQAACQPFDVVPRPDEVARALAGSGLLTALLSCAQELLAIEQRAHEAGAKGDIEPVATLIEEGSLLAFELGQPSGHASVKSGVLDRLAAQGVHRRDTVCLRHFGGVFFSYRQAIALDVVAEAARSRFQGHPIVLASLLGAASDAVNTVGKQFAQPLKPRSKHGALKHHLRTKILNDRSIDIFGATRHWIDHYGKLQHTNRGHIAVRADYRQALEALRGQYSVVYADPPYTRDHYSRYYHVLETLALGDDPRVSMSNLGGGEVVSKGMYRNDRHQSEFCIKSKAADAFQDLFNRVSTSAVPLVLSYSSFDEDVGARPRLLSIKDISDLAAQFFSQVAISNVKSFEYSKLNHRSINKAEAGTTEVIISCR